MKRTINIDQIGIDYTNNNTYKQLGMVAIAGNFTDNNEEFDFEESANGFAGARNKIELMFKEKDIEIDYTCHSKTSIVILATAECMCEDKEELVKTDIENTVAFLKTIKLGE